MAEGVTVRIGNAEDLGHFVRQCRAELGLTQAKLAHDAGVSRRWLSDLEAGKATAEFGLILRTLHTLGLIVDLQPEKEPGQIDLDVLLRNLTKGVQEGDQPAAEDLAEGPNRMASLRNRAVQPRWRSSKDSLVF